MAVHSHAPAVCGPCHVMFGTARSRYRVAGRKATAVLTGRLCAQELQAVKNNMIGEDVDGAVSGISGGERRRVSVGIGLVTDARAIFLDEPTTGLDSDSAEQLIALLSHLAAHKHRTVRSLSDVWPDMNAFPCTLARCVKGSHTHLRQDWGHERMQPRDVSWTSAQPSARQRWHRPLTCSMHAWDEVASHAHGLLMPRAARRSC